MATPISDAKALDIRERYEWLHELNNDAPEHDRIRPGEIDAKIAAEHKISVTTVRDIVMGLTHPQAGGPIDHKRRERRDLLERETESLGETEARRRFNLRCRNIDPTPKVERLVQRVTVIDSKGRPTAATTDLAPGESLRVELVPVGGE